MNYVLILLGFLLAFAQSANISKPRVNLTNTQNKTNPSLIQTLPEERRQLSIFPRSSRKFVVTPLVYRRYVTQSPMTLTKKPLMKKLVFQDKVPNLIRTERTSRRPVMNTKFLSPKPIDSSKNTVQGNMKTNLDFIDKSAAVSYDTHNNNFYDGDFSVHGDYSEDIATVVYPNINNKINALTPAEVNGNSALKIEDFIFTPKVKPTETIKEASDSRLDNIISSRKVKAEVSSTKQGSKEDDNLSPEEIADWNEFILVDDKDRETYIRNAPEEAILPTESILELKQKMKRSINVIEEENPATTVSGYRFTFKDTNFGNNMMFKNINS